VLGAAPLLVPELACTLASDPAQGAATARAYAERYLRLPNYTKNLERFGFGPADLEGTGSERLISQIIPNGSGPLHERIKSHLDAGADQVVIQPLDAVGFTPASLTTLAGVVAEFIEAAP
jgi:hypothetical protein